MSLAQGHTVSSWLVALAISRHGFALSHGDFGDALHLRYRLLPPHLPSHCTDGEPFTVEHALTCMGGRFIALRHNEVRDLLGELLAETCHHVSTELPLQGRRVEVFRSPSAITVDNNRLDLKVGGFGVHDAKSHFLTSGFQPTCEVVPEYPLSQVCCSQETEKRLAYGE